MNDSVHEKRQIRVEALRRRDLQADRDRLSRTIFDRLIELPEYAASTTVMIYLDIRSEVQTRWILPKLWADGKRVVVPHCLETRLRLFHLKSLEELAPGMMQILEPKPELHDRADRQLTPSCLDLIIVPGVAFDRSGGRLGYGRGYYDKLLRAVRPEAAKVAVCFECQLFPKVPMLEHDVRMEKLVTEETVYATSRLTDSAS